MLLTQVACLLGLAATLTAGRTLSPGPAPGPDHLGVCGRNDTRVTICFPGTPQSATCVYSIIENYAVNDISPNTYQVKCPRAPIFGYDCLSLPGTLYVAYGPCNSNDVLEVESNTTTLPVSDWLDVLGINSIVALGGLFVRGYAFQKQHLVKNVTFLPDLETLFPPNVVGVNSLDSAQVTISGLPMPAIPKVTVIPNGLSLLNSPDPDFLNPPRFTELVEVGGSLSIAGCNRLKTLEGLDGLAGGSALTNIEVINDLILANISALEKFFKCQSDGETLLNPDLLVGTFGMHPVPLQAGNKGCTLNTPRQVCSYIANSNKCPPGTEYIRFRDGTIQRIPSEDFSPVGQPSSRFPAPAPAPIPAPAPAPADYRRREPAIEGR